MDDLSPERSGPESVHDDIKQRLAVLEERTKPRKKTALELLQGYGGILALAISLLYSFPLGVWDRLILDPQKQEEKLIVDLRDSLQDVYRLTSDAVRAQTSIQEPVARDMAVRAQMNQILLILTKNEKTYTRFREELSAEELVSIGLAYQLLYNVDDSVRFFEYARQSSDINPMIRIEIDRQLSKSYFTPTDRLNLEEGRSSYRALIEQLSGASDINRIGQLILIQSEWGLGELMFGDWKCGEDNMDAALAMLQQWQYAINDQGNMKQLFLDARARLARRPGQPAEGCPVSG